MPLDRSLLRLFQREVERQCSFGLLASLDLDDALRTRNHDRIWASAQSFLVAAGNVSKLLWPSSERIPGRGSELRQSLNVGANSALEPRTFRNHFEHFDERLDDWAISGRNHSFVDSNVGPPGMIGGAADSRFFLRNFDTANYAMTYRGNRYELRPVVAELETLWTVANREWRSP